MVRGASTNAIVTMMKMKNASIIAMHAWREFINKMRKVKKVKAM